MKTRESLEAVCINKSTNRYVPVPQYRLVFQTPRGICSFRVSSEVYDHTQIGDKNLLVFEANRLVSFGSTKETVNPAVTDRSWLRPAA